MSASSCVPKQGIQESIGELRSVWAAPEYACRRLDYLIHFCFVLAALSHTKRGENENLVTYCSLFFPSRVSVVSKKKTKCRVTELVPDTLQAFTRSLDMHDTTVTPQQAIAAAAAAASDSTA